MLDRIIVFCKFVTAAKLLRQILPLHLPLFQCLLHCTGDGLIAQSLCLSIHRLHGMHDAAILFRCKYLRLLHSQSSVLFYHTASKNEDLAHLQNSAQIRHIIPGQLQCPGHIPYVRDHNLDILKTAHGRRLHKLAGYRKHPLFPQFSNGNRFFVGIVGTRIIVKQLLYCLNSQFCKQACRFFPNSLQDGNWLLIHNHSPILQKESYP